MVISEYSLFATKLQMKFIFYSNMAVETELASQVMWRRGELSI